MSIGKKPTVGWRYYYGVHLIPARKADAILAIRMADKLVWEGDQGDGFIEIDDPEAFGGDEREGGFSGRIAVMLGSAAQGVNAYMASIFGALTPAYRGVVSLFFERPYFNANSARLPAISIKQVNIEDIHKGWQPEKAIVDVVGIVGKTAFYIAMDVSLSMATGTRLATQAEALASFVRSLKGRVNSVKVVAHSATINASIQRLDCDDDDYEDIALWIEGYTELVFGGDWNAAVSEAAEFFENDRTLERKINNLFALPSMPGTLLGGSTVQHYRRVVIFTTDGIPAEGTAELAAAALDAIGGVEVYAFNIDLADTTETEKIDNTPRDGVPVVSGSNPRELQIALQSAFRAWVDLNPAHIQRCLLIDPMRGGTATEDEIGDSFAESADEYLSDRFGLSVVFSGADGNMRDRMEIDRHCDAVTFRSRKTGKWEHRRVRDDFDLGELPVLDGTVVKDWSKLRRPKARELPNKLTVLYTDRENGKSASVTLSNPVAVRAAGRVRQGQDARYPFVTNPRLAHRICARDVSAVATPLLAGEIPLSYLPADFEMASVVLLRVPRPGLSGEEVEEVPVRITEVRHGAGTDSGVWLKVVEHRFELGAEIELGESGVVAVTDDRARAATVRMVEESPYYVQVLESGQDAVDEQLAGEAGLARLMAAAAKPSARHLDATVGVDAGGGWTDEGTLIFSAATTTTEAMLAEADQTTLRVALNSSLTEVVTGQLARIGTEIVRVDAMAEDAGEIIMTIGRGCLDTVPAAASSGADVLFFGPGQTFETDYLDGEAVDVKLLTRTGSALLTLPAAPVDTVTFASRAIRPYPPGRFKLNGSYAQDQFTADVVLTWAHRDRTMQTTPVPEDHDASDIGPEAGTTYRVRAEALNAAGAVLSTVTDENVGGVTTYDWDDATVLPSGTVRVRFSVASVRDGYESWQRPALTTVLLLPPTDLTVEIL